MINWKNKNIQRFRYKTLIVEKGKYKGVEVLKYEIHSDKILECIYTIKNTTLAFQTTRDLIETIDNEFGR